MIGVKVDNETVLRKLRSLAAGLLDTTKPNRLVSIELYGFVMKNFQTEGGMSEAGAWEPLAEGTVAWKERHGYSMILQNTGALRQSFAPFYDRQQAGVGAQQIVGASDDRPPDIAEVHEFGLGDVPARPMLPSQDQATGLAMRIYNWYVGQEVRKAQ